MRFASRARDSPGPLPGEAELYPTGEHNYSLLSANPHLCVTVVTPKSTVSGDRSMQLKDNFMQLSLTSQPINLKKTLAEAYRAKLHGRYGRA